MVIRCTQRTTRGALCCAVPRKELHTKGGPTLLKGAEFEMSAENGSRYRTEGTYGRRVTFNFSNTPPSTHRTSVPKELQGCRILPASKHSSSVYPLKGDQDEELISKFKLLLDHDAVVQLNLALDVIRNSDDENECIARVSEQVSSLTRLKKINIVLVSEKDLKRSLSMGLVSYDDVLLHLLIQAALRVVIVVQNAHNSYDELTVPIDSARKMSRSRLLTNKVFRNLLRPFERIVVKLWYELTKGKKHESVCGGFEHHCVSRQSLLFPMSEHESLDYQVLKPSQTYERLRRDMSEAMKNFHFLEWHESTPLRVLLLLVISGDATVAIRTRSHVKTFRRVRKRTRPGLMHRLLDLMFKVTIVRNLDSVEYSPDGGKLKLRGWCRVLAWLYVGFSVFLGVYTGMQNLASRVNAYERVMDCIQVMTLLLISVFGLLKLTSSDVNAVRNTLKGYRIARSPKALLLSIGMESESQLKAKLAVRGKDIPWMENYNCCILDHIKCTGVLRFQQMTRLDDIVAADGLIAGGCIVLIPRKALNTRRASRWFHLDKFREHATPTVGNNAGSFISAVVPIKVGQAPRYAQDDSCNV